MPRFGRGWDAATRTPVDELDEAAAAAALGSGTDVVVAEQAAPGEVPDFVLVLREGGRVVTTQRYDEHGRLDLVVHHHTVGPGLFRTGLVTYDYPDDGSYHDPSEAIGVRALRYGPDGLVHERTSTVAAAQDVQRSYVEVDLDPHWVPPLEWGAWERFGLLDADDLVDPRRR